MALDNIIPTNISEAFILNEFNLTIKELIIKEVFTNINFYEFGLINLVFKVLVYSKLTKTFDSMDSVSSIQYAAYIS